jgi:hypothetical protein
MGQAGFRFVNPFAETGAGMHASGRKTKKPGARAPGFIHCNRSIATKNR